MSSQTQQPFHFLIHFFDQLIFQMTNCLCDSVPVNGAQLKDKQNGLNGQTVFFRRLNQNRVGIALCLEIARERYNHDHRQSITCRVVMYNKRWSRSHLFMTSAICRLWQIDKHNIIALHCLSNAFSKFSNASSLAASQALNSATICISTSSDSMEGGSVT